jgi:drug/metabolite transporter (DMT)-like permease
MLKFLAEDRVDDGFTTNLVRYPLASLLYIPFLIAGIRRGVDRRFWRLALIPAAINILGQTLWAWSPYYLEAGMLSFLVRICVLWSIVGAFWLFRDERPLARSPLFWIGAALSIGGFVAMSLSGSIGGDSKNTLVGIVIILFTGMFWGLYGVAVRYVIRDYHPLFVFSVIGGYTSIAIILMAPLGRPSDLLTLKPGDLAILILSSIMGIAMAHGLYYAAIQRIGLTIPSITMMSAPFISLVGSAWILGERFNPGQCAGGIVLIAGIITAMRAQMRLAHPISTDPHELGTE